MEDGFDNDDLEGQMYQSLVKVQKELGDIKLLQSFLRAIQKYYIQEYDYDKDSFTNDTVNIANEILFQKRYDKLGKILNSDELELLVAIAIGELENYCLSR